jgi:hypothetical protein
MNDSNDKEKNFNGPMAEVTLEYETKKINPWYDSIRLITWGFLLTGFNVNVSQLQYILPTIGVMLLYLGFRNLHKTNRWFYIAWILSGIKMLLQLLGLIIYATPLNTIVKNNMALGIIRVILQLVLLSVFRTATRTVFYKEGIKPDRDPILGLLVWTIFITICAFTPMENSWIVFIPLTIFYLKMIRVLYKIGDDMGVMSDAFIEASVKVSYRVVARGYLITCLVSVIVCSAFANHISLDALKQGVIVDSEIRLKLLRLGFPKDIITDISDDDIAMLSNAEHVEYSSDLLDYGRRGGLFGESLQATTVYVELPDNFLYAFVYFVWKDGNAHWQDGFNIFGEDDLELLNGKLLFHKNGTDYTALIPRLKCEEVTINNWFVGSEVSRQISGAVSYPFHSENQRGYIFYQIKVQDEQYLGVNCFKYMHNSYPFQLPYKQTEHRIRSTFSPDNVKQHFTNFYMKAYREANDL